MPPIDAFASGQAQESWINGKLSPNMTTTANARKELKIKSRKSILPRTRVRGDVPVTWPKAGAWVIPLTAPVSGRNGFALAGARLSQFSRSRIRKQVLTPISRMEVLLKARILNVPALPAESRQEK